MRGRALLIESEDATRRSVQLYLQAAGFDVRAFARVAPALADPGVMEAGLLAIASALPDGDAIAVLRAMRGRGWAGRAILMAPRGSPELAEIARNAGFGAVLPRPVGRLELLAALAR